MLLWFSMGEIADTEQDLVPALVEAVKAAGLVLVSDVTHDQMNAAAYMSMPSGPDEADGMLEDNSVLRFSESIDM